MKKKYWPYLFIAPFFIAYDLFSIFPIAYGFYISLTSWDGFSQMKFVGLSNYIRVFLKDAAFYKSVLNSIIIMLESTIPIQVFALILALILNYKLNLWGGNFLRNAYFMPYVTIPVAIGLIFASMFDTEAGLINFCLLHLGIVSENIDWIHTAWLSKPMVAFVVFWKYYGYVTFILLAGLQGIPKEIYEAAQIDGARYFTAFFRVILPMLKPVINFSVTMGIMGGLRLFEEPMMVFSSDASIGGYNGGMQNAAQTMNMKFIQTTFQTGQYGYGAAMGYTVFAIILIISLSYFLLMSNFNRNSAERGKKNAA